MPIEHPGPALWQAPQDTDASAPERTARAFLEAARTHPLGSPQRQALVQEAGVHATFAQVWATEAVLARLEDLTDLLGRES
ncbi:hypothetical protein [Nocardiopsis dassonvillei]|uniref:hypothetical protein n=1 Tax=Nocardiopsis dassonvillei TaxID=2014 RepID=UPI00363B16F8